MGSRKNHAPRSPQEIDLSSSVVMSTVSRNRGFTTSLNPGTYAAGVSLTNISLLVQPSMRLATGVSSVGSNPVTSKNAGAHVLFGSE